MLQATNISMKYASKTLFEDINLKLDKGKRYGLIGANGAGKSTFLKILSKEIEPSSGDISIESNLKMGVLSQNQYAFEDLSLKDAVLIGNKRLYDAIKEKEKLYAEADLSDDKVNERLSELEMICVEEDPMYECDVVIEKILEDLGFVADTHNELMKTLTGGDKFKILLAQVLFPKPDILLLDEPTNNLDLDSIAWLENNLKKHEGTLVVISHDRHFINAVCTHILDLDFKTLREFSGNYDDWYIASNLIAKQQEMERSKKLKEKAELEDFIRRFGANASKARQATSRQKQLDKLNVESLKVSSRREPSINFKIKRNIGNEVLSVENLSHAYGDKVIFSGVDLMIKPGDKIALIGANGVGKSTLCKILSESMSPDSGVVKWGATIEMGYFPQDTSEIIKGDSSLYEWLRAFDKSIDSNEIRTSLGRMLFSGEEQEKSVGALSGGEKHRIMLSKLMILKNNFLILDEPTNHLDLEAIIALGEALYNYQGGIICVSHDRELIDSFANRIIELSEVDSIESKDSKHAKDSIESKGVSKDSKISKHSKGVKITDFHGTYEEYLESKI
ncbi:ATP-binding cassette domain-containing protein [Helicobacter saguini]|uniref:Probable ATP-binding protein YbiT n=1 Tax=Helicobacter saguini TaxID=1548018 RepID=A0A347VTC4_9HELI|nr:ATP-binding cassette domain-containing protein [Helicobacter saguini]MWV62154.1 ATP-binding cassette domain-containing protein [Helicobacter saguini]MWV67173.1 ATP-binding cassette domain-containing protein [Helicobacter saguini]MWV69525.1 ATP-binding cassette domain-containing protein [Helicobacter saguini]MWV70924.1 ATP-binding cassette domain-containing protein [Helicobacter saguini]TLD92538.1 ATP-binding cassette domain-containing protein [Helicobacter saguini]